jgi:hypothetical protein
LFFYFEAPHLIAKLSGYFVQRPNEPYASPLVGVLEVLRLGSAFRGASRFGCFAIVEDATRDALDGRERTAAVSVRISRTELQVQHIASA